MNNYKEKYENLIEQLKKEKEEHGGYTFSSVIDKIVPELKESEDERIRKGLIKGLSAMRDIHKHQTFSDDAINIDDAISWLEKQKVTNEDAEQEKNNFVSGKFLYCRASFNEFKEGESYWFEYIGNDNYIGRSDNVLNQQFHITPRLLYSWFIEQHPYIEEEEQKQVECSDEDENIRRKILELVSISGNGNDWEEINNWLEKQKTVETPQWMIEFLNDHRRHFGTPMEHDERKDVDGNLLAIVEWLEGNPNIEQKIADKVEPKFMVGDWIVSPNGVYWHIDTIRDGRYQVSSDSGKCAEWPLDTNIYHRFTIQDAKKGDVLYCKKDDDMEIIVMYLGINIHNNVDSYCRYNSKLGFNTHITNVLDAEHDFITPATKEQRDLLFKKVRESGYEWDTKKKELKKIEQKPADLPKGENYGIGGLYNAICILEKTLGKVEGYQSDDGILEHKCAISAVKKLAEQNSSWGEEDSEWYMVVKESILERWRGTDNKNLIEIRDGALEWLKSIKDKVQPQSKQEWSEEDEYQINTILHGLDLKRELYKKEGNQVEEKRYKTQYDWLKSLKPNHWKPSEEQLQALKHYVDTTMDGEIELLYNDLLKL